MLYCKKCKFLSSDERCENCGNKKLCEPKENDPIYLTTKDVMWSGVVEDILSQNDIPYLKQGWLGAGMTWMIGNGMEKNQFFVPFVAYEKSKELLAGVFEN